MKADAATRSGWLAARSAGPERTERDAQDGGSVDIDGIEHPERIGDHHGPGVRVHLIRSIRGPVTATVERDDPVTGHEMGHLSPPEVLSLIHI